MCTPNKQNGCMVWNNVSVLGTGSIAIPTHAPSINVFEQISKIPETTIEHTFKDINTIAIQHAGSIILHKRKINYNQPLPLDQ